MSSYTNLKRLLIKECFSLLNNKRINIGDYKHCTINAESLNEKWPLRIFLKGKTQNCKFSINIKFKRFLLDIDIATLELHLYFGADGTLDICVNGPACNNSRKIVELSCELFRAHKKEQALLASKETKRPVDQLIEIVIDRLGLDKSKVTSVQFNRTYSKGPSKSLGAVSWTLEITVGETERWFVFSAETVSNILKNIETLDYSVHDDGGIELFV